MKSNIVLRAATAEDAPAIGRLFSDTIRSVNAGDYNPEQIELWSSAGNADEMWKKKISEQYFVLAILEGEIAGFSSITPEGYLDFMYVHKDHQRKGIAQTLLAEIEQKAAEQKNTLIHSHVSITARGFFEKYGYEHKGNYDYPFKGMIFVYNLMEKKLDTSD